MLKQVLKPAPREKKPKQPLRSNSRLKTKPQIKPKNKDPIPAKVMDEVDARDNLICQGCGRPVTRAEHPYHHITFRSGYKPTVRLWTGLTWEMVPTWFKKHSKENLVTLCVLCHMKPHESKGIRRFWEKWRDKYYKGEC